MDMNLFVTLDARYAAPLRVMLFSLCESNPRHRFDVYVLHSSLGETELAQIRAAVPPAQCRIIDRPVPPESFADMPCSDRFPKEACYRIFAAQLLPDTLDRALYLDPDIVVRQDLEALYTMALGDSFFAAATHMFLSMQIVNWLRFDMKRGSQYINSGVMLFHLARLRQEQKTQAVYDFIEKYRKRLVLFDQDILNGVYHTRTAYISPRRYNLDEKYMFLNNINPWQIGNAIRLKWVQKNTVIIHFNGPNKPWLPKYKGRFKAEFYDPVIAAMQAQGMDVPGDG